MRLSLAERLLAKILRICGTTIALGTAHLKCCRDRQEAITQDSWDDACTFCAISFCLKKVCLIQA
jgi:hypothetical protein